MIKIEKLSADAIVTFERNGTRQRAALNYLISHSEFETLVVESGKLTYSVDELEVLERVADVSAKEPVKQADKSDNSETAAADTSKSPSPSIQEPKPQASSKIVFPKKK